MKDWIEPLSETEIQAAQAEGNLCPECEGECFFVTYPCGDPSCCQQCDPCDLCGGTGYKPEVKS